MYSLNVPVPGAVSELAWSLRSRLTDFEQLRDEHTLVVKRLEVTSAGEFAATERVVREAIRGTAPFEARITGIDVFSSPPAGPSPVVFLAIESPELVVLHEQLVQAFGPVPGLEGEDYHPHVTLARGGDPTSVDRLIEEGISRLTFTVNRLIFWDATREMQAGEVRLPA